MRLVDIQKNVNIDDQGVLKNVKAGWFRIIDTSHSKKGLDFCIPLEYSSYDDYIQNTLLELNVEDEIYLQLKSINNKNTSWVVNNIK